ncbi:MAG: Glutamate/gamma-aminobutyrate antiporter [Chlamydiia bacterium]|nr:Glutamate/gamma-aminobutyrate antiporter [Chlamydiia bacterium]
MINIIAVDSIRTLPIAATFGFSLVFFYLIAGIGFFIPAALISAELGTGWPNRGGIYVWVREALGRRMSFAVIWLNWLYNVVWFPTIMSLISGFVAYIFFPTLADSRVYMVIAVHILFWGATFMNLSGMKRSSQLSTLGAIYGTLVPMAVIIILGVIWLSIGRDSQISYSASAFIPQEKALGQLAFFNNVLFGLIGLEMVATHAAEMKDPRRDYPKALCISVVVILASIVLGSLAIATVVPHSELNLITGSIQAFQIFLTQFGVGYLTPVVAFVMSLGALACVASWIIGPTKGLLVASQDGLLPEIFSQTNRNHVPRNLLILQGCLVSILSFAYILFPSVNSSFWFLSAITGILALLVYIALFVSGLVLHHKKREVKRSFTVPGGRVGIYCTAIMGIATSLFGMGIGFIPPTFLQLESIFYYEMLLGGSLILLLLIPFGLYGITKKRQVPDKSSLT